MDNNILTNCPYHMKPWCEFCHETFCERCRAYAALQERKLNNVSTPEKEILDVRRTENQDDH